MKREIDYYPTFNIGLSPASLNPRFEWHNRRRQLVNHQSLSDVDLLTMLPCSYDLCTVMAPLKHGKLTFLLGLTKQGLQKISQGHIQYIYSA